MGIFMVIADDAGSQVHSSLGTKVAIEHTIRFFVMRSIQRYRITELNTV